MKVAASYMAAYLLALYYCSRDDEHAPEEAVKFALNRYISDSCKEDAQTQLQEACDESDDLGYTEEYGDGPRTLTARGLDQINAAAMQKGDYIELVHSDILDADNWIDDYLSVLFEHKQQNPGGRSHWRSNKRHLSCSVCRKRHCPVDINKEKGRRQWY